MLYNAACVFCGLEKKAEALDALRKAWNAGFKDSDWARRDPDLALLHGDPEFERLYPEQPGRLSALWRAAACPPTHATRCRRSASSRAKAEGIRLAHALRHGKIRPP